MKNINGWKWLCGDVNYLDHGGFWYKHLSDDDYIVLELVNIAGLDILDEPRKDIRYLLKIFYIDINIDGLYSSYIQEACEYYGADYFKYENLTIEEKLHVLASYGVGYEKKYLGNNYRHLFKVAG